MISAHSRPSITAPVVLDRHGIQQSWGRLFAVAH
jgi:hypothetical protein